MAHGVHERLIKGFAAQGFAQVVNLIIQVASVPLYLHYWGKVLFGEWLLLSTVPSYFALSDLGFANAAGTEMTLRVARGDRKGALEVFQSAWILVTLLSLAVTIITVGTVTLAPIERWLKLTTLSHGVVVAVVTVLVIQVFFALQRGLLGNGYRCDGNFAVGTMVTNMMRLIEFLVGAVVVVLGAGLWGLALVTLVTRIVENGIIALDLRRRSPWLQIGWRHAKWQTVKALTTPAITFMGFPIGNALSLQGMLTVVGTMLGPAAVVLFSTSRTLTRFVWQILNTITNTIWVELSTALGAGEVQIARTLHRRSCQVALWSALSGSTVLLLTGPWIFRIWTHSKVHFDATLFALLLLVVVCNSLWSTSYAVLLAVNRHQTLAAVYLAGTGLSLVLGALFTKIIGLNGAALALLVIDLFMSAYVIRSSLALLHDDLSGYVRAIATPPVGWLLGKLPKFSKLAPEA